MVLKAGKTKIARKREIPLSENAQAWLAKYVELGGVREGLVVKRTGKRHYVGVAAGRILGRRFWEIRDAVLVTYPELITAFPTFTHIKLFLFSQRQENLYAYIHL